jgi:putative membrane protein
MKIEKKQTFLLIILFVIGILLHWWCYTRKYALILTTPFLLTISTIILHNFINGQNQKRQTIFFLISVFIFTFIIEVVGVKTGLIFGDYNYGKTLWLKIGEVPVVIGINWVLLVFGSGTISYNFCDRVGIKSTIVKNIVAGIFLVLIDYFIEPIAMKLDYWQWKSSFVPVRNYIAWFLVSQFVYYSHSYFNVNLKNRLLKNAYLVMLFYFILLKFILAPCF